MDPLTIAAVAGVAFSAYNSFMSLKESKKQALETQKLRLEEADSIAEKYKINLNLMERKGEKELKVKSLAYGTGAISQGQYFSDMAEGYTNMVDNLHNLKKEGEFEVSLRQREAALAGAQASAYNRAVVPTLLGSGLQAVGSFQKAKG